jgi:hypothetical protein
VAAGLALILAASAMAMLFATCGGGIGTSTSPGPCGPLPPASTSGFQAELGIFLNNYCYEQEGWEHDSEVRTSDGVHNYVKVWYSPSIFNWMTVQNRQGPVPDGAMLVKEEHATLSAPLMLWSVMVKDSAISWDGWYWGAILPTSASPPPTPRPGPGGCAPALPAMAEPGMYCLNCHASAIDASKTYASTAYLDPPAQPSLRLGLNSPLSDPPMHSWLLRGAPQRLDLAYTGRIPSSVFGNIKMLSESTCMVPEQYDHVVSASPAHGGPAQFLTSDQCANCHDASGTLSGMTPNMLYTSPGQTPANLSIWGEWRYSMMGLSGRDPIFFAQLDTESTVHSLISGQSNGAAFVQDLCLRCHGVMGQRQFHLENGNGPGVLFTRSQLDDSTSTYGALARDGVSCTVCHHMSAENLGAPSTYTGEFILGRPNQVYGQFPSDPDSGGAKTGDSVIPLPMEIELGITPMQGRQIEQANLCASCHTIQLPVYKVDGDPVMENGQPKTVYEQATYLEWLNSGFAAATPCQTCHMPGSYQGTPLTFKIANIEDSTFPRVPQTGPSTRLPDADITLQERTPYRRHQLLGINVFALEMFDQFVQDLGLFGVDPNLPFSLQPIVLSQQTAAEGAVLQAQTETAQVAIISISKADGQLQADVEVRNLAGHKFPSGVSFRRAFINFQVLDGAGKILWASGNTNSDGVIVDTAGNPLVTEFFGPAQQSYQPHFWTGNPITSDTQVEIYEELVTDPNGQLTTSFLSLNNKVKDNRIQPQGWSPAGVDATITAPVGTGGDPSYRNGCGCDVVRYQIPLIGQLANAAQVQATLYYQSIPPYYLRQRAEEGPGPDTARLVYMVNNLNLSQYPAIADWRLQIATSGVVALK